MFKRQTLFVLGAGSSYEVDLPLGTGLAKLIGKKMDVRFEHGFKPIGTGDFGLFDLLKYKFRQEADRYQSAAWLIRDGIGFAQSIDDFLDQHRSNQYVSFYGKAAIVRSILEAERNSKLFFGDTRGIERFNSERFAGAWFVKFMYMLCRGIPKENIREIFDRVSFVVFNYDRCLEYFLLHALQKAYGISEGEASEILENLHIIHPYGSVGHLKEVHFGAGSADYIALAGRIKTYTEQIGAADVINEISQEVSRAQAIVFLGFAYHNQNLLMFPTIKTGASIYGTAHGMSDSDVSVVTQQLIRQFAPTVISIEKTHTCTGLFDFYAKSLTGGD